MKKYSFLTTLKVNTAAQLLHGDGGEKLD